MIRCEVVWIACGFIVAAAVSADPSHAGATTIEGIGGWEGDGYGQGYGFVAAGASFPAGASLVVPIRVTGSYLYYSFRAGGEEERVRAPGASGMSGVQTSGSWGNLSLLAGAEVRWERRARDPDPWSASVARLGFVGQAYSELIVGKRFRPTFLVAYSGSAEYLYGRAAARWQCSNLDWTGPTAWFLGLDGTGQGNADTQGLQAGGLVECALTRARISFSVRGGYKTSDAGEGERPRGGYWGAGIYRRF